MKSKYLLLATVAAAVLGLACDTSKPLDLVKYNSDADVPRVSVQDAKKEIDAGTAVMVDSRPEFAYNHEHIAGAISIPVGSSPDKFAQLPKGKKVFIYCS